MVRLAQLVRASDCGSEGQGFETLISPKERKSIDFLSFILLQSVLTLIPQRTEKFSYPHIYLVKFIERYNIKYLDK